MSTTPSNHTPYDAFLDLAAQRRSCRRFTSRPVTRDTITRIIETARIAPSAVNRQPWTFVVADNSDECAPLRSAILQAYPRPWIQSATAFIVCCVDHHQAWHRNDGKDHASIDIAIATEHICLAATALGIGSCWVCNFDAAIIATALNLPEGIEPAVIIPIGYPDTNAEAIYRPFARKPLNEILKWGKF